MSASTPHYLLFSESRMERCPRSRAESAAGHAAQWRFVLEKTDGSIRLEADDAEPEIEDEHRLELLAVVRGLEALNEPSRVTLVTRSRYVTRGFRYRLDQWRENDWCWERYGEMTPVRNSDLWRRVDAALRYHRVECRVWRFDGPETRRPGRPKAALVQRPQQTPVHARHNRSVAPSGPPPGWLWQKLNQWLDVLFRAFRPVGIGLGTGYLI